MVEYRISRTARFKAPPNLVYSIIADYRNGHPQILPKQFTGVEAGTVIRFQMKAMGRTTSASAVITEPEPGRILVETATDSDV